MRREIGDQPIYLCVEGVLAGKEITAVFPIPAAPDGNSVAYLCPGKG